MKRISSRRESWAIVRGTGRATTGGTSRGGAPWGFCGSSRARRSVRAGLSEVTSLAIAIGVRAEALVGVSLRRSHERLLGLGGLAEAAEGLTEPLRPARLLLELLERGERRDGVGGLVSLDRSVPLRLAAPRCVLRSSTHQRPRRASRQGRVASDGAWPEAVHARSILEIMADHVKWSCNIPRAQTEGA